MRTHRPRERGAIIIHVAIALIALLAFVAFAVDYGVMWVSRRQAQNAADAGALAGAQALAFDGGNVTSTVPRSAVAFAANNVVWGQANSAANVDVWCSSTGLNCAGGAGSFSLDPCGTNLGCVRADVMRGAPGHPASGTAIKGAPIPAFFGHIVGLTSQNVRATATARAVPSDGTECLRPWIVADKWCDNPAGGTCATWDFGDTYDPPGQGDVYTPPDWSTNPPSGGTGFSNKDQNGTLVDYGRQFELKMDRVGEWSSGWAMQIDLAASTGGRDVRENIVTCNGNPMGFATWNGPCTAVDVTRGCFQVQTGMDQGNNLIGVNDLVARDPGAFWNTSTNKVGGSAYAVSPRIVPVGVFDVEQFRQSNCTGATCMVKMVNMFGFFVEGMCGDQNVTITDPTITCKQNKSVIGRMVTFQGTSLTTIPSGTSFAFGATIQLVR
jgi:hypothetical protein